MRAAVSLFQVFLNGAKYKHMPFATFFSASKAILCRFCSANHSLFPLASFTANEFLRHLHQVLLNLANLEKVMVKTLLFWEGVFGLSTTICDSQPSYLSVSYPYPLLF